MKDFFVKVVDISTTPRVGGTAATGNLIWNTFVEQLPTIVNILSATYLALLIGYKIWKIYKENKNED